MSEKPVVILTGFGPFSEFKTNASWEVVKTIQEMGVEDLGVVIETRQIEVSYTTVSSEVPKLWAELKPSLVIHLGVSGAARELTIETCAHKSGYCRNDVNGKLPPEGKCKHGDCEDVHTDIDVTKLVEDVNAANIGVSATISKDAGRYLCEFIYYTSLSIKNGRTLFVHVPDINKPYTLEQMAQAVKLIISSIMHQVKGNQEHNNSEQNVNNNVI